MFKNLLKLEYKRNGKEAVGFYFAYFFFFLVLAMAISLGAGFVFRSADPTRLGSKIGICFGVLTPVVLSFFILYAKNLLKNITYILLAIVAGGLGIFGGFFLGFIPVAYLTTLSQDANAEAEE